MTPANLTFTHALFWIQVWGVPFDLMAEGVGEAIGRKIGRFIKVDRSPWFGDQASNLRIRVEVPIDKPLLRGGFVLSPDGQRVWVQYKYEQLASFCHRCGLMGHATTQCNTTPQQEDASTLPYGEWLKASHAARGPQPQPMSTNQPANQTNPVASNPPPPPTPNSPEPHPHPPNPDTTVKANISSSDNHGDLPNPNIREDHGLPKNKTLTKHGQPDMATFTSPTPIIAVSEMTLGGDPRADTSVDLPSTPKEIPKHTLLAVRTTTRGSNGPQNVTQLTMDQPSRFEG